MAYVEFRHLEKVYRDGTRTIHNLSLCIADGEFLVLLGPSGCGKSTLMRMLAGLEAITGGEIVIDGQVVNDWTPQQRNIAMVFQNYALYPHMTVRRNLEFPLRMRKFPKDEIHRRVAEAARALGITPLLERKPKQLSGGQRQRVAMGRAIVRDPAVFLMDEPLSNLDAKLRLQIRSEIAALQRRLGTTTLYVTHDQVEAMTLGQRVAVMRKGVLQQVGSPQALYEQPANLFVAGFLGSPAMNIFQARPQAERDRLILPFGSEQIPLPAGSGALTALGTEAYLAGLRPEAFLWPEQRPALPRIEVHVATVESLGHEAIVYFQAPLPLVDADAGADRKLMPAGEGLMAARLPADRRVPTGESITLAVDVDSLYWFDQAGRTLQSRKAD